LIQTWYISTGFGYFFMSSHHVVKEIQEPAIFLLNEEAVNIAIVQGMLEWSPVILVSDECFPLLAHYGIKVDALICERNFANNFEIEISMQQPMDVILIKDSNQEIPEGLKYLAGKGCTAVNIFGTCTDRQMFEINRQHKDLTITYFSHKEKYVYVGGGSFEKWLPKNNPIKIFPSMMEQEFKSHGLVSKKNKFTIDKPTEFFTKKDGVISIKSDHREFFISEVS